MNFNIATSGTEIVLLITSIIVMGLGVRSDWKLRKFPNQVLLSIFILGLIYGAYAGHLVESVFGFLIANLIGIFFYTHHMMAPGDMKYLSTIFLFISIRHYQTCVILIIYMLISGVIMGYFFYKRTCTNTKEMTEKLKNELTTYRAFVLYHINLFHQVKSSDFSNTEEMLANTMPFTLPMYTAFVATVLTAIATGGLI